MKKFVIFGGIAFVILFVISVISIAGACLNWYNIENRQRLLVTTTQQKNQVIFDNVWKTISQQVQVSDDYKNSFKEIYVGMADARFSKGDGSLMKWVQESNPNFDMSLFKTLMHTIEGKNMEFAESQKQLLDLGREHDLILTTPPASLFYSLLGKKHIDLTIVTSTRTENAFKTGKDDNVDIHSK